MSQLSGPIFPFARSPRGASSSGSVSQVNLVGCLVLNLHMPELHGLAVVEWLTADGACLPIVVVTRSSDAASCVRALKMGVLDFLEKPIDRDGLLDGVRKAIMSCVNVEGPTSLKPTNRSGHAVFDEDTLFDGLPVGVALVDGSGRFIAGNSAFCRFLGYSSEELLSKTVSEVTPSEDFAVESSGIAKLTDGLVGHYRVRKRYIRKDGAVVWGKVTLTVMSDVQGQVLYGFGVIENLSATLGKQEDLTTHVERLGQGQATALTPAELNSIGSRQSKGLSGRMPRLTPREKEILDYLVVGRTLKDIAEKGKVSPQSVWKHQKHILQKFAVNNAVELVRVLLQAEFSSPGKPKESG